MIQPLAPGSADRTHRIARHGRRPYITDMFESEFPAHTAAIKRKIASIECDDALILPHRANPAGSDFREPQPARPSSRARSAGGGRRRRSPDHVIENDKPIEQREPGLWAAHDCLAVESCGTRYQTGQGRANA